MEPVQQRRKTRCAIYTRKSSDDGLEQEFNSLDAQREACAAYIASQKHEGWIMLADYYDDGGISGGTLERPALQRLMADVDEGRVDQIVVYKIDRLTRSLADFAKLVDRLDAMKASFVSVTQSFNTATSMGRLTLNVLLSFAQFEREVTAERIRDKISASKKKGLWMGGNVPLGYEADGRTLKINEAEAETIRTIYRLYEELGSIRAVTAEADRIRLQGRVADKGSNGEAIKGRAGETNMRTARSMGRGPLHYILSNPVYAGRIRHKEKTHEGLHDPIIEPERWEQVQTRLQAGSGRKRGRRTDQQSDGRQSNRSLLIGKLFDETDDPLTPSHANKKGRRYRYYVSSRLITKGCKAVKQSQQNQAALSQTPTTNGWRLPAKTLEKRLSGAILNHLQQFLTNGLLVEPTADEIGSITGKLKALDYRALDLKPGEPNAMECDQEFHIRQLLGTLEKAQLSPGEITIQLDRMAIGALFGINSTRINPESFVFTIPFQMKKRGVESKLILDDMPERNPDPILINNLAKAHVYYKAIKSGKTFDAIAMEENLSKRRILQIIDLAFLAPAITRQIIEGNQPIELTSEYLQRHPLPSNWKDQKRIVAGL